MQRALLNNIPDWALFLMVEGVAIGMALAILVAVNRWLHSWKSDRASQVVTTTTAMVATFFALILAFGIVNLYSDYQSAGNNVRSEANSLSQIARDALAFPPAVQRRIDTAIANYVVEVQSKEFPAMRQGALAATADPTLTALFQALESYAPQGSSAVTFYRAAVSQLNQVVADRESRVNSADSSLPAAFMGLLLFTGLLSIVLACLFTTHSRGLDYALVAAVASVVAAGLLTVLLLEFPFSGSVSASSSIYSQGYLGQLVSVYH